MHSKKLLTLILLLIPCFLSTSCSEYWWTRGQPPSVEQLVRQQKMRFSRAKQEDKFSRKEFIKLSDLLCSSLEQTYLTIGRRNKAEVLLLLEDSQKHLIALEGKVSIGSRAALGELNGQFRGFQNQAQDGKFLDKKAFGLFTARTFSFLASELSVPGPSFT